MTSVSLHWAAAYVGLPWRSRARGPREFDCWGLVVHLARQRLQVEMPVITPGQLQFEAVCTAARSTGWSQVSDSLRADDIVIMRRRDGQRHCGYGVEHDGRVGVLHADGTDTLRGPTGCVVFHTLAEATAGGYGHYEIWRHA